MLSNRLSERSKRGAKALTTTLISILILLLGALLVQPALGSAVYSSMIAMS